MIFIDPRVGSKHLVPLFEAMNVPFEVTPMEFADCAFIGNGPDGPVRVGIEIKGGKGGSDFIQSMQSNRLVGAQAPGLAENYDRRYLIVEGLRATRSGVIWTPPRRHGEHARPIFAADVEKFLTGVEESGLRLRRTKTPKETVETIVKILYAFWSKDYDAHTSITANVLYIPAVFSIHTEDPVRARIRRVVVALKAGVGVGRSKAVADTFRSVVRLVAADVDEWANIPGIGKTTAGAVVSALRAEISREKQAQKPPACGVSKRARSAAGGVRHPRRRANG